MKSKQHGGQSDGVSRAELAARESVRRAFHESDDQSDLERLTNESVARAFGRAPERQPTENELPLQKREFGAVAAWAAKEAAATATQNLSQALMRADRNKGIYTAEAEAQAIAAEAYAEAAKRSPYEDTRQESVTRVVTKLAEQFSRGVQQRAQQAVTSASKQTRHHSSPMAQEQREAAGRSTRVELREVAPRGIRVPK